MVKLLAIPLCLFLFGVGGPVERPLTDCPGCTAYMSGNAFPQVEATGVWVPGVKTAGKCEGEPCAGALQCRFNFTAGVVINPGGTFVVVNTSYTQEMPAGPPLLHEYPPFVTGSFSSEIVNWPVPCGGTWASYVQTPTGLQVLSYGMICTGCL